MVFVYYFYRQAKHLHGWLAGAILFLPSVVFWGSGLLKDTITLAALGFLTYAIYNQFIVKKIRLGNILIGLLGIWVLFVVKKYILLCYLPAALLWVAASNLARIKSVVIKLMLVPGMLALLGVTGFYAVVLIGEDDPRYSLDKIALTAKITAYDIGFYSGRDAGSGYSLGELDGTFTNLLSKFPQAVNVSLFRPYLWEVRNPLMVLAALESLALLVLTLYVFFKIRFQVSKVFTNPQVIFCFMFSIAFAFSVGVSTYNFGTLTRYKIPLLPFYLVGLIFLLNQTKSETKVDSLAITE
ncbi:MAG: hypothetical protein J0L66_10470 [Cytophagales bacterium]|nr:hypothetical protein [Cytophagales bacterium]